eukprot:SAG25_NODE_1058_length_4155_cov_2.109221_3_plen_186_part_00
MKSQCTPVADPNPVRAHCVVLLLLHPSLVRVPCACMAFRCCRAEEKSVPKLKKSIYNFSALTKDDAAALIKEITSDVIPDILKPLDPEDDTFAKARDVQDLPRVKAPPTLIGSLLPFQEKGLGWMLAQEQSEIKGGILADQVGGQPGGSRSQPTEWAGGSLSLSPECAMLPPSACLCSISCVSSL